MSTQSAESAPPSIDEDVPPTGPPYVVRISDDRLEATLEIPAATSELPPAQELEQAIRAEHGIPALDPDALEDVLTRAPVDAVDATVVARGKAAVPGEDGRLEWLVDLETTVLTLPDGSVDHYHRRAPMAFEGQHILRVVAPTAGTAGVDVQGKPLPALDGQPAEVQCDEESVGPDPQDPSRLVARRGGKVEWEEPRLGVTDHLEVENVDYASGGLEFDGAITVRGEIKDHFDVWCRGTLEVGGWVGASTLRSEASMTLAGVAGGEVGPAVLEAKRDIAVARGNGGRITAGRHLTVAQELLFSDVTVGGDLNAEAARVVGGTHRVTGRLVAREIGAAGEGRTVIWMGYPDEDHTRLVRAKRRLDQAKETTRELLRTGSMTAHAGGESGPQALRERMIEAKQEEARLERQLVAVERGVAALRKRRRIHVSGAVHAGTEIHFAGCTRPFTANRTIQGPVEIRLDSEQDRVVCASG